MIWWLWSSLLFWCSSTRGLTLQALQSTATVGQPASVTYKADSGDPTKFAIVQVFEDDSDINDYLGAYLADSNHVTSTEAYPYPPTNVSRSQLKSSWSPGGFPQFWTLIAESGPIIVAEEFQPQESSSKPPPTIPADSGSGPSSSSTGKSFQGADVSETITDWNNRKGSLNSAIIGGAVGGIVLLAFAVAFIVMYQRSKLKNSSAAEFGNASIGDYRELNEVGHSRLRQLPTSAATSITPFPYGHSNSIRVKGSVSSTSPSPRDMSFERLHTELQRLNGQMAQMRQMMAHYSDPLAIPEASSSVTGQTRVLQERIESLTRENERLGRAMRKIRLKRSLAELWTAMGKNYIPVWSWLDFTKTANWFYKFHSSQDRNQASSDLMRQKV
ncbi:hypothetical protein K435DRAFT_806876 [Dendrothele bispora CBS 962.96]|uniref:Mid2 domain-containing protein n=1 Tax=Dendrothele bispora (strain CBS 962.96) TaxID=1314807 RepID=A0A4S8L764_DENBC|nr:hypothetical protein K435DRAFT_806876 [Dendrothele bispora CBS 962.96]